MLKSVMILVKIFADSGQHHQCSVGEYVCIKVVYFLISSLTLNVGVHGCVLIVMSPKIRTRFE